MKLYGIGGQGTGKLGNQVFAIRSGEQIVRQYQPVVANPNTEGQVASRSRLKLMSQLAAIMAPAIAIPADGLKSKRNNWISENYGLTSVQGGAAQVNLNAIQMTKGIIALGEFSVDRTNVSKIACELADNLENHIDRVVYIAFEKSADGTLHMLDSKAISVPGASGHFEGDLKYTDKAVVVYAYGVRDNTDKAKARFANMVAPNAEQVAKVISSRQLTLTDITTTETKGLTMLVGETTKSSDDVENILVNVTISGNGSATGAGRYPIGQQVTLHATPDAEAEFVAWKRGSASGETLSTNANYTFVAEESIAIVAVFRGGPVPHYTIAASASPAGYGSVSGAGSYEEGASVTLSATPAEGKRFLRWTENGTQVSTSASYTFTASSNRTLVAVFDDAPASGFSSVQIDGNDWNQNKVIDTASPTVRGNYLGDATHVCTRPAATKPAVGSQVVSAYSGEIQNDAFSFHGLLQQEDPAWLCACTPVSGQENTFQVVEVYEYNAIFSMD